MPVLVFKSEADNPGQWKRALERRMPELEVRVWPDIGDPDEAEYALLWKPPAELLSALAGARAIFSVGAGIDHLPMDRLPPGVPVVRMVDPTLTEGMTEFVVFNVLRFHRNMHVYAQQQREQRWRLLDQVRPAQRTVGIMGMGVLGCAAARALLGLGFDVRGWSRSGRMPDGVQGYGGDSGLAEFLGVSGIVICLLPLTPATRHILRRETFERMPRGAFVINAARGGHLVEADLLAALDSGHIGAAALDVFETEPLPAGHPFWSHPKVFITPHAASLTNPETGAGQVVEGIRRLQRGEKLHNVIDPRRGY